MQRISSALTFMTSNYLVLPATKNLHNWFLHSALPLWSRHGVDRELGGFFEKLQHDFIPTPEFRRSRLVARQIYMFSTGFCLGWEGQSKPLVEHGLNILLSYFVGASGEVYATCRPDGSLISKQQNLYDAAFVLIALAKVAHLFPSKDSLESIARRIATHLSSICPHSLGGYIDEATPNMLCANPHMHLFEAFLDWTELQGSQDGFWRRRAEEIAQLALDYLILPDVCALPEYFDMGWRPIKLSGELRIEPGHQFEWSWLLARWSELAGVSEAAEAAEKLCNIAETYGVDPARNVAFESINGRLAPSDLNARLWQQTERVKAWHIQGIISNSTEAWNFRDLALASLQKFLAFPIPGLWYDLMDSNGCFSAEPVKASSGYHIARAIETLYQNELIHLS